MSQEPVNDPQYWRDRAEQARSRAEHTKDSRSKRALQGIADFYDRLAEKLEQGPREDQTQK
jgi:hypothetical protein